MQLIPFRNNTALGCVSFLKRADEWPLILTFWPFWQPMAKWRDAGITVGRRRRHRRCATHAESQTEFKSITHSITIQLSLRRVNIALITDDHPIIRCFNRPLSIDNRVVIGSFGQVQRWTLTPATVQTISKNLKKNLQESSTISKNLQKYSPRISKNLQELRKISKKFGETLRIFKNLQESQSIEFNRVEMNGKKNLKWWQMLAKNVPEDSEWEQRWRGCERVWRQCRLKWWSR